MAVLAAAVAAGGPAVAAPIRFTLVERATSNVTTDTGPKGDSVGDILTFANPIHDAANRAAVGTDNGYCLRTVVAKAWQCSWTTVLTGGQIDVSGPFLDEGDSLFTVVGGTGAYAAAGGQMTLHPRDKAGAEYDLTFVLTP